MHMYIAENRLIIHLFCIILCPSRYYSFMILLLILLAIQDAILNRPNTWPLEQHSVYIMG